LPGGNALVFSGAEGDHPRRVYYQTVGDSPRALTEEGTVAPPHSVSPDGTLLITQHPDRTWHLHPIHAQREPIALPGLTSADLPIRWSVDQKALFVVRSKQPSAEIYRYELGSNRLDLWQSIQPGGSVACGGVGVVQITGDGTTYVYSCGRLVSELFLASGLR
jgi:hypothetical protein